VPAFNGFDVLMIFVVLVALALVIYARRRAAASLPGIPPSALTYGPPRRAFPLDPTLALSRSVRRSYDGLPYRTRDYGGIGV
jgi:hypothetical protein